MGAHTHHWHGDTVFCLVCERANLSVSSKDTFKAMDGVPLESELAYALANLELV
jgi:hypothetical protein